MRSIALLLCALLAAHLSVSAEAKPEKGRRSIARRPAQAKPGAKRAESYPGFVRRSPGFSLFFKMTQGEKSLRMMGKRVTILADGTRLEERICRVGGRMKIEYLSPEKNKGEVVIDNGEKAWHYHPGRKKWAEMASPRRRILDDLEKSLRKKAVSLQLGELATIAGRNAQALALVNKQGKNVEKLWIDAGNGLVLKREHYDQNSRLNGSFEYVSLDFAPNLKGDEFAVPGSAGDRLYMRVAVLKKEAPFPICEPALDALPETLKFKEARILNWKNMKNPIVALHYQVGKNHRVTLFQTAGAQSVPKRPASRDNMNSHFWQVADRSFALRGDLSLGDLKKIAATVKKRD